MKEIRLLNWIMGPGSTHRDSNQNLYSDRRTGRPRPSQSGNDSRPSRRASDSRPSRRGSDSRPSRQTSTRTGRPTTSHAQSSNRDNRRNSPEPSYRDNRRRSPEPRHRDHSRYESSIRPTTSNAGSLRSPVVDFNEGARRDPGRRAGQSQYNTHRPSTSHYASSTIKQEPRYEAYEPRHEVREPRERNNHYGGRSSRSVNCGACHRAIECEQSEECTVNGCGHFHSRCVEQTRGQARCPRCYQPIGN